MRYWPCGIGIEAMSFFTRYQSASVGSACGGIQLLGQLIGLSYTRIGENLVLDTIDDDQISIVSQLFL